MVRGGLGVYGLGSWAGWWWEGWGAGVEAQIIYVWNAPRIDSLVDIFSKPCFAGKLCSVELYVLN